MKPKTHEHHWTEVENGEKGAYVYGRQCYECKEVEWTGNSWDKPETQFLDSRNEEERKQDAKLKSEMTTTSENWRDEFDKEFNPDGLTFPEVDRNLLKGFITKVENAAYTRGKKDERKQTSKMVDRMIMRQSANES